MSPIDRIRGAATRMIDVLRREQQRQLQREQSQPNGQGRQYDDPDRQLQEHQARIQREIQQERQARAQREAAQQGEI